MTGRLHAAIFACPDGSSFVIEGGPERRECDSKEDAYRLALWIGIVYGNVRVSVRTPPVVENLELSIERANDGE